MFSVTIVRTLTTHKCKLSLLFRYNMLNLYGLYVSESRITGKRKVLRGFVFASVPQVKIATGEAEIIELFPMRFALCDTS